MDADQAAGAAPSQPHAGAVGAILILLSALRRRAGFVATALALWSLAACVPPPAPSSPEAATAAHFEAIRAKPDQPADFLRRFPKGADLHNHLSGAIYAESFIGWSERDGGCVDPGKLTLAPPPCGAALPPAAAAATDPALYRALVDSLSMQDFAPPQPFSPAPGHDHFFATFDKFAAAEEGREGDMLAEAMERAAADHVLYVELMWSPGMSEARKLGKALGWDDDLAGLRDRLLGSGLESLVAEVRRATDERERRERALLHCDEPQARQPGCDVVTRYLAQIIRTVPPEAVFAQAVLAFRLVESDPRFVGLNIVAPEDNSISLRDYSLDMRMLGYLHGLDPAVPMSLHAGELVPALPNVRPEDLRFHVREAVEIAGARRIGHGVDVFGEDGASSLLAEMAAKRVMVEINLTSNDQILGVVGERHPFMALRRAGVPTALSTDDEGVERIDLTHEYVRAAREYPLSYADLKNLSRNSLEYAFLPGASLWRDALSFAPVAACAGTPLGANPTAAECQAFLAGSEKAHLQWTLEADFARFEAERW
jgi:adenosine deaminase